LIRGERDHNHRLRRHNNRLNPNQLDVPVRVSALNYRLPYIPTSPPQLRHNVNKNITTFTGSVVVLPCRVLHIGLASVSWLRHPDLTVLSHGDILFSSSNRLRLLHSSGSTDWNLQITGARPADSGLYECQVNTDPKLSRLVHLTVTQARVGRDDGLPVLALQSERASRVRTQKTEILAPPQIKVYEGGSVTLECVVTEHDVPPEYFKWLIDGSTLDFHEHRGGILLEEERKTRSSATKLTLTRMELLDSGVYTCSPQAADSASVRVTVNKKVEDRRFQQSSSNPSYSTRLPTIVMLHYIIYHC